jgi:hypothetical protein
MKWNAADYIIAANSTKLFIASQSDGAIYQIDLPIKLNYQSSNKDKVRSQRDVSGALRRINVSVLKPDCQQQFCAAFAAVILQHVLHCE